jgi:hypothetical protein
VFNSIKNSDILKEDEELMIKNWINSNKKISLELIYKATRDGVLKIFKNYVMK